MVVVFSEAESTELALDILGERSSDFILAQVSAPDTVAADTGCEEMASGIRYTISIFLLTIPLKSA